MTFGKHTVKQVVELDLEFIVRLEDKIERIESALMNMDILSKPRPEEKFITPNDWCKRCKVSRWKYDQLMTQGLLRGKRIGRKFYIEIGEVDRFFAGELKLLD